MSLKNSAKLLRVCGRRILRDSERRGFAKMLSDPENKGERQDHVNFDILGTWDNRIDFSIELQQSIRRGKPIPKLRLENTGVASVIGRRDYNEDRFCVKQLQNDLLYFGIFDGHGGDKCAQFCSENLHKYIVYWLQRGNKDLEDILEKSFLDVNNAYAHQTTHTNPDNRESGPSGTTAVVCLLRDNIELAIAHVGDSRALLCRSGEPKKLTVDHNADLLTERQRIHKSGGTIVTNNLGTRLVNGRLAMTRSIGDFDVKPYGVTCLPDTRTVEIKHGKDAFLVLTTDGINYVMNDTELVNVVNHCRQAPEAAQLVVEQALHYGCDDNATAIVIPFGAWGKFKQLTATYMYSFGRELCRSNRF